MATFLPQKIRLNVLECECIWQRLAYSGWEVIHRHISFWITSQPSRFYSYDPGLLFYGCYYKSWSRMSSAAYGLVLFDDE
jgi:hypothetical protein